MPTTRNQAVREAVAASSKPPLAAVAEATGSSGARQRSTKSTPDHALNSTSHGSRSQNITPDEPPRFTIDLSLPPEHRYLEVCAALRGRIIGLTSLFDEVVGGIVPWMPVSWLHIICRLLLRGVYDREENAELEGISKATSVPIYLLVCFNVLLDLFMGCSSGGAAIRDKEGGSRMLHFRTLDWDMPALRRIIVQLDFVTEKEGPVVASSITYAGFVGVLTGVRQDFSVSLNFRPNRIDGGKFWPDAQYKWHLLMVLLGYRPSISSFLRGYLLPRWGNRRGTEPLSYADILKEHQGSAISHSTFASTACYLCFCSGAETTVVEKDYATAKLHSSTDFVVVTNNDDQDPAVPHINSAKEKSAYQAAIAEIVEEAQERKQCAEVNWSNMRLARRFNRATSGNRRRDSERIGVEEVVELVQKYPTTNEMTHFACVMDPQEGTVLWCRVWKKPVSKKWIKEHS